MEEHYTVGKEVSMLVEGKPFAYHGGWRVFLGDAPVGPAFGTKAEATYYMHHHYLTEQATP